MHRVLLAEDSEFLRSLMKSILRLAGCEVQLAADGKEALKIWKSGTFDLVITDLVMPNSDGLELISAIRRQDSAVKIIGISGGSTLNCAHFLEVAKMLGADYCLLKPITLGKILETLELVLAEQPAMTANSLHTNHPSSSSGTALGSPK